MNKTVIFIIIAAVVAGLFFLYQTQDHEEVESYMPAMEMHGDQSSMPPMPDAGSPDDADAEGAVSYRPDWEGEDGFDDGNLLHDDGAGWEDHDFEPEVIEEDTERLH